MPGSHICESLSPVVACQPQSVQTPCGLELRRINLWLESNVARSLRRLAPCIRVPRNALRGARNCNGRTDAVIRLDGQRIEPMEINALPKTATGDDFRHVRKVEAFMQASDV